MEDFQGHIRCSRLYFLTFRLRLMHRTGWFLNACSAIQCYAAFSPVSGQAQILSPNAKMPQIN